jgi:hypothetical protein
VVLYKYTDRWGLKVLENLRLKVTPPNQFNDPFELTPRSRFTITPATIAQRAKTQPENYRELYELMQRDGLSVSFEQFLVEMPKIMALPSKFGEFRTLARRNLYELDMQSIDEASKGIGLICVSKRPDSIPMWSYYADKHKGFAIGIDIEKIRQGFNTAFGRVRYVKHRPRADPYLESESESWSKQLGAVLFSKSLDWRHEQEFRCAFFLHELISCPSRHSKSRLYFLNIDGEDIRDIVFGCWINRTLEKRIRAELKRRPKTFGHVNLFRCRRHRSNFELEVVPAD